MKRIELIKKLVSEGMSEKTLANFSDKQIIDLSERMLSEQPINPNQPQVTANVNDPNFTQVMAKLKQSGVKNINVTEEEPSAGLSKEKKSEVVKKAKKGGDIGKKGKGFKKLADKASKQYGSKEKGEKVAAAAMWKNLKREGYEEKKWVKSLVENEYFHNFTSKGEIMELIQVKLNEGQPAPSQPRPETPVREKPTTRPGKPKRENPFEPKHDPKPKAGKETIKLPNALKFNSIGIKFKDQK